LDWATRWTTSSARGEQFVLAGLDELVEGTLGNADALEVGDARGARFAIRGDKLEVNLLVAGVLDVEGDDVESVLVMSPEDDGHLLFGDVFAVEEMGETTRTTTRAAFSLPWMVWCHFSPRWTSLS
jgi:hypothetical protein